jgi:hypothetical protein
VIADLGPHQRFPHSILITYKLEGSTKKRVEFGATVSAVQLGRGAPGATLLDHLIDLIPALKYSALEVNETQFSNKFAGWEYRLRLPELRGLQLYAEHSFDDMDPRRWKSTFWEDAGHVVGFSLQDLAGEGALSGTFELQHTGVRYYQHTVFSTGMALRGTLLGNPLGNEGNAAYLRLRWDEGFKTTWTLDAAVERRGGNVYATTSDNAEDDGFRFLTLAKVPAEWRQRVVMSWMRDVSGRRTTLQAGLERVANYAFADGAGRANFIIGAAVDAYRR